MKTIKKISFEQAHKGFDKLIKEVATHRCSYSVIRYGKEIARIVPPSSEGDTALDPEFERELDEFIDEYDAVLRELAKR